MIKDLKVHIVAILLYDSMAYKRRDIIQRNFHFYTESPAIAKVLIYFEERITTTNKAVCTYIVSRNCQWLPIFTCVMYFELFHHHHHQFARHFDRMNKDYAKKSTKHNFTLQPITSPVRLVAWFAPHSTI